MPAEVQVATPRAPARTSVHHARERAGYSIDHKLLQAAKASALPWAGETPLGSFIGRLGRQNGLQIARAVQNADDFDAVCRRPVKEQVLLKGGTERKAP